MAGGKIRSQTNQEALAVVQACDFSGLRELLEEAERIERYLGGRKSGLGNGLEAEGEGSLRFPALALGWMLAAFIDKRNSGGAAGFRERSRNIGL